MCLKVNEVKNERALVDKMLKSSNENRFNYGLQGIVKAKLRTMPNNNFTEEQKNLINSPYKRVV